MERFILITVFCLLTVAPVAADEPHMTPYELAEVRLLAEWTGQAEAQYALGNVYYHGEGVRKNFSEALSWYRKAADQGLAAAQNMLGLMHDMGEGVPQDFAKAIAWFQKAADQGHAAAQYSLGTKYAEGQGVPQNYVEAYVWFSLAAASGYANAVNNRDTYAAKISREEMSLAQQRAAHIFEASQQESPDQKPDNKQ